MKNSDKVWYALESFNASDLSKPKRWKQAVANTLDGWNYPAPVITGVVGRGSWAGRLNPAESQGVFNPHTLDAVWNMTLGYEDTGIVRGVLSQRIIRSGTSMDVLAFLTGIPIQEIRDAMGVQLR